MFEGFNTGFDPLLMMIHFSMKVSYCHTRMPYQEVVALTVSANKSLAAMFSCSCQRFQDLILGSLEQGFNKYVKLYSDYLIITRIILIQIWRSRVSFPSSLYSWRGNHLHEFRT